MAHSHIVPWSTVGKREHIRQCDARSDCHHSTRIVISSNRVAQKFPSTSNAIAYNFTQMVAGFLRSCWYDCPMYCAPHMNPVRLGTRSSRSLYYSTQGSVAVITALVLVAMTMAAGVAVDYVMLMRQRSELQVAADAGAIAGAREIPIANSTTTQVDQVASNYVRTNLGLGLDPASSTGDGDTGGGLLSTKSSSMMTASSDEVAVASDSGSGSSGSGSSGSGSSGSVAINATMNEVDGSIIVEVEKEWTPYFSRFLGKSFITIHAQARAQVVGIE